jgi:glycerophosphoryl diester phosphodiesterase
MAVSLMLALSLVAAGPELIAHRGESADAPENTLAAFRLAWERKVPAIELDVHLTRDGRLAVCHDFDTKRCAGVACKIRESLWDELKDLDVGQRFNPKFTGEKLPLLDDALATIPAGARCFIEVKCGPEAVPALAKVVDACGKKPEQLAIISFNAEVVAEAKRKLPQLKAYYLSSFKNSGTRWSPTAEQLIKQAKEIKADGLDLAFRGPLDEEFARKVRQAKLELYVWTVNDADVARDLVKLGVDGITTDKAAWLREELSKPIEE